MIKQIIVLSALLLSVLCHSTSIAAEQPQAQIEQTAQGLRITTKNYSALLDNADGSCIALSVLGKDFPFADRQVGQELWRAGFKDKTWLSSEMFSPDNQDMKTTWKKIHANQAEIEFLSKKIYVKVIITALSDALQYKAEVRVYDGILLDFALPGNLRFVPSKTEGLVFHGSKKRNVGIRLKPGFFKDFSLENQPVGWSTQRDFKEQGYRAVFDADPRNLGTVKPCRLSFTAEAKEWLGKNTTSALEGLMVEASRPLPSGYTDIKLADTVDGLFFGGCRFSGKGALFRVGGRALADDAPKIVEMVCAAIDHAQEVSSLPQKKVAIIKLANGPESAYFARVPVESWSATLKAEEISGEKELIDALQNKRYSVILNPYGESVPLPLKA